ncbi:MAG: GIY-YIG nuclease [Candidatus Melainabacteria bacterium HGW-Melainabacteria-1]|nr:MAG: GIY-YIG nuclease [Candidatus Melainabacteria bacterium HGW-Melainabacteria-1]
MQEKFFYVYLMASQANGTLYTGYTNDLIRRVWEHRNRLVPGFTSRYGVCRLVWYEQHVDVREALKREKQLKSWNRAWKISLIQAQNPEWEDLYPRLV